MRASGVLAAAVLSSGCVFTTPSVRAPAAAPNVGDSRIEVTVLAAWSTGLATWAIGRRVVQLLDTQRSQAMCLARLREGALVDAESRRRG